MPLRYANSISGSLEKIENTSLFTVSRRIDASSVVSSRSRSLSRSRVSSLVHCGHVGSGLMSPELLPMVSYDLFSDKEKCVEFDRIQMRMNQLLGLEAFTEVTG